MSLRGRVYRELDPKARETSGLSRTNTLIVLLVLASLVMFAAETEPTLSPFWRNGIETANYLILLIFAIEYGLRVWSAGERVAYQGFVGRMRFALTPYSLADFLAFFPELFLLLVMPDLVSAESIMALRVLRLARLLKIARLLPAFDILARAMRRAGIQLLTALALAVALIFLSAVILYFIEGRIEGQEAGFGSIPRAIWWAVATLTTVGYGDVYPITPLGRVAAGLIALAGVGVVALPAGVFAGAFADELRERAERKKEQ